MSIDHFCSALRLNFDNLPGQSMTFTGVPPMTMRRPAAAANRDWKLPQKKKRKRKELTEAAVGARQRYLPGTRSKKKAVKNVAAVGAPVCDNEGISQKTRQLRIWFMGHKIAICQGREEAALAALRNARETKIEWSTAAWKSEMGET